MSTLTAPSRQVDPALGEPWTAGLDASERERLAPFVEPLARIERLATAMASRSDIELRRRADSLRRSLADSRSENDLIPEWFALVRETAHRVLGERPFAPQLVAALALQRGFLVEMGTGEGKTLAAVAPVALTALRRRGVHVLTYNDYLAERDARWMGPVYERLGLSTAFIREGMSPAERRAAYGADITYVTVKEAGFDLLRDSLALDPEDQVHRPFHAAIVDEADSILVDEARIPLVIAGTWEELPGDVELLAGIARQLEPGSDFDTDEEARNIFLTDHGVHRVEALLGCGNLFDPQNTRLQAEVRNALHARILLRRDVDYIVRDGGIELVDELTGRIAENRHWPDGLQAALEAKEGLHRQPEGRILGSITIQHFLQQYPRLAGMTATASAAAPELDKIYDLEVLVVPPHRRSIRDDRQDLIFISKRAKRKALLEEIGSAHRLGRPVLVGTVSVADSEELAASLVEQGIACRVLNARNDSQEAEIIAEAGAVGAVTISTNMAGRGTDIRLGGSGEVERQKVVDLGGLYVIGTNRHESRRIDDQLRGRAGRQGDPGASRFLISLEDDLLERCGIHRLVPTRILPGGDTDDAISHPAVQREVERAQRIVEGQHGDIRSRLLEYSRLVESQRQDLQHRRQEVLSGKDRFPALADADSRASRLAERFDRHFMNRILGRITLLTMDELWSDHLERVDSLRDEVLFVRLDGRHPLVEFCRAAGLAYEELLETIDDRATEILDRIRIRDGGVDWKKEGLLGPSSTWTYLVNDSVYGDSTFQALSTRPGIAMWAVLACWWLLLPWAVTIHVKRWRQRRKANLAADERTDPSQPTEAVSKVSGADT